MCYFLLLLMTVIGSFGAFFLKLASGSKRLSLLLKNKNFYFGICLYVLAAAMNIIVLRTLPYNIVLPLTSITYIWTAIIGHFLLKEKLHYRTYLGISCVVLGVIVLVTSR